MWISIKYLDDWNVTGTSYILINTDIIAKCYLLSSIKDYQHKKKFLKWKKWFRCFLKHVSHSSWYIRVFFSCIIWRISVCLEVVITFALHRWAYLNFLYCLYFVFPWRKGKWRDCPSGHENPMQLTWFFFSFCSA